jgi:hypothetical protein
MFNNWKVIRTSTSTVVVDRLSEDDAVWMVSWTPGEYYAVNPVGSTYPPNLHEDGDYDPAFN